MHLPINTLLQGGKYRIVRFISSGGFGCTYEAEHIMLNKRVAIKEFFVKDFCNRDESTSHVTVGTHTKVALVYKLKRKFLEEAIALSKFHHEHIVQVTDVFEENGTAYYVMDYINGKSIHEILKTETTIAESRAVKYICQMANALKYVHSQNRLHLDIKPGNIMIDEHDNAILIDFGASKQYDEESGENTSTLLGKTPGYAPIEQMGNSVQTFTPATDIYSLGATLYKMLSGVTPPEANILVADDESLKPLPSYITVETRTAVEQAMKVKRKDRPQSVEEFIALFSKKEEVSQKPVERPKPEIINNEVTIVEVGKEDIEKKGNEEIHPSKINESPSPVKDEEDSNRLKYGLIILFIAFIIGIICVKDCSGNQNMEAPTEEIDTVYVDDGKVENVRRALIYDAKGNAFRYTGEAHYNGTKCVPDGYGEGEYKYGHYRGYYKNGLRNGQGVFDTKDGNHYEGTFSDDMYESGTITLKDRDKFTGKFKNGQPYKGKWYNPNGNINSEMINRQLIKIYGGLTLKTEYADWKVLTLKITDSQSIVTKSVYPKNDGTWVCSSNTECLEDADTGEKYYITGSSIGFEKYQKILSTKKNYPFEEYYPMLPSSVKRINIMDDGEYYVKGLRIR